VIGIAARCRLKLAELAPLDRRDYPFPHRRLGPRDPLDDAPLNVVLIKKRDGPPAVWDELRHLQVINVDNVVAVRSQQLPDLGIHFSNIVTSDYERRPAQQ
jgi:hypothetical protein